MKLIPVIVDSHEDSKLDQYPICFYWMNIKYEIKEISDRWYQAQTNPEGPVSHYFKVRTASKSIYILKHELENDQWFIVTPENQGLGFSSN